MSQLSDRVVTDLRESGLILDDIGDAWFVLRQETDSPSYAPRFLHMTGEDIKRYVDGMTDADVDGAFGPEVTPDDARYRLTVLHLEEALESGDGVRYISFDGDEIRWSIDTTSIPELPPGDYEWRPSAQ